MSQPITLQEIVHRTSDLPSVPAAAIKVMRETQSSTSSAATIAHILSVDQSLSARVLRLANSAYYSLVRKVSDLQEAVVVLGMRNVRNLAVVASTYPWMERPLQGYSLGPRQMWSHAIGTALGAQTVAAKTGAWQQDEAFTAGLLHDLGKVALSVWLDQKLAAAVTYATHAGLTFDQAERKFLGFDHCEVGGFLARDWNLPTDIEYAVRYHHTPDEAPDHQPVVDCVHVGNFLAMGLGYGLGGDGLLYALSNGSLKRLSLNDASLDELSADLERAYHEYDALFQELAAAA